MFEIEEGGKGYHLQAKRQRELKKKRKGARLCRIGQETNNYTNEALSHEPFLGIMRHCSRVAVTKRRAVSGRWPFVVDQVTARDE